MTWWLSLESSVCLTVLLRKWTGSSFKFFRRGVVEDSLQMFCGAVNWWCLMFPLRGGWIKKSPSRAQVRFSSYFPWDTRSWVWLVSISTPRFLRVLLGYWGLKGWCVLRYTSSNLVWAITVVLHGCLGSCFAFQCVWLGSLQYLTKCHPLSHTSSHNLFFFFF